MKDKKAIELSEYLKQTGQSQGNFAKKLDVTRQYISFLCTEKSHYVAEGHLITTNETMLSIGGVAFRKVREL